MKKYDVAAYIWPAYTGDDLRARIFWPEGMGEWQTVKSATAKFDGHSWPRRPLWGYVNEADPMVMKMEIDVAVSHGVNVFIYDWYWFDGRPFLENCLNDGFLKAENNHLMKFYLMWANQDVNYLWDKRNSGSIDDAVIWGGDISRAEFEKIARRIVDKYFSKPNYYMIDNKPVFMIYDLPTLLKGFGGEEETKDALDWFNDLALKKGFSGVHFQFAKWGDVSYNYSGIDSSDKGIITPELIRKLGFSSLTNYQMAHFTDIDREYSQILPDYEKEYSSASQKFGLPYFPHVSVGWDNNPRFENFRPGIVKNNTPQEVGKAFELAKQYVDAHPHQPPLITVNSWNEWTETSYLEPDDLYGYGYLNEIKRIFTDSDDKNKKR